MDDSITAFAAMKNGRQLLSGASIAPDELIYANGPAMWLDKCDSRKIAEKLKRSIAKGRKPSSAFLVKNTGLFIAGNSENIPAIRDTVVSSLFIRSCASQMGGITPLNKRQEEFIIAREG